MQKKLFQKNDFSDIDIDNESALGKFFMGYSVFRALIKEYNPHQRVEKDIYGKVFAYNQRYFCGNTDIENAMLLENIEKLNSDWEIFISDMKEKSKHGKRAYIDKMTGEPKVSFSENRYYKNANFENDVATYFSKK